MISFYGGNLLKKLNYTEVFANKKNTENLFSNSNNTRKFLLIKQCEDVSNNLR